jgi:hypothetical protein
MNELKGIRGVAGFVRLFCALAVASLLLASRASLAQQAEPEDGAYSMGAQGRMVRGTVTATGSDRFTLKTEAGDIFQVVITTNTRLMKDRQPVKIADIRTGDGAGAMGVLDASTKTIHAAGVFVVDAAQVKKLKDDMGRTYISGKVTAIDDLELTIKRQDGVTQKIAVDEGTSFKKGGRRDGAMMRGDGSASLGPDSSVGPEQGHSGGESITLADIKVGDTVVGPGALKSGIFVPTQLTVLDPAAMGRRRRQAEAGDPAQAPAPAANAH